MTLPRSGDTHPKRYGSRPRRLKRRGVGEVPKALNRRILALQPRQVLAGDRVVTVSVAAQRAVLAELCHWRVWSQAQWTLTPTCRTSVTKIAEHTRLDRRTVGRALQALYGAGILDMPSPPGEWTLLIDHQREAEDSCALSAQTVQPGAVDPLSTECSDGASDLSTECSDGATNSSSSLPSVGPAERAPTSGPGGPSVTGDTIASASTAAAASTPGGGDGPRHPRPSGSGARAAGGSAPEPPAAAAVKVGFSPCKDEDYTNRVEAELQKVFHDRSGAYEGSVPVWRNVFRVSNTETLSRRSVNVHVRQPDAGLEHEQGTIVSIGTRNEGTLVEVPLGALVASMWEHKLARWKWMLVLLALWEKAKDSNLRNPVGYLPLVVGDVALGMRPRRWMLLDPPYLTKQAWDDLMAKRRAAVEPG